jgi:glycosyltransferase involved in cell wall biosynthesis
VATPEAITANGVVTAATKPSVLILGPALDAMSGVSTHLRMLLGSPLAARFDLRHFQVGSEGRSEGLARRVARMLGSPFALAAAVRAQRARVVHLNTSMNVAFCRDMLYAAVAKLCGARVLCQIHGGKLPHEVFAGSRTAQRALRRALKLPDALAVLARIELDAYRRFVPTQKVVVAANAVEYPLDAAPVRDRFRGEIDEPLELIYVGRLAREKGLYELLHALATLRARGTRAVLVVAGSGPEEPGLRRLAAELGLARAVAFLGPLFGAEKARLLAAADMFMLPSYSEGLPYALLEAMAMGVPVVASDVGAIRDVVIDGVHGRLIAPRQSAAIADAIETLAADRHRLARMGAACRARIVSAYSVEHLVRDFDGLYSTLCADAPRRPRIGTKRQVI